MNDGWIFCLAVLLSSTLVYNSRGTIDNTAVEKLQYPLTTQPISSFTYTNIHFTRCCYFLMCCSYVAELAEQIKIRSTNAADEEEEEDCKFVQFFPSFTWVVRDFTLELVINGKTVTEDEYLEFALQLKKGI